MNIKGIASTVAKVHRSLVFLGALLSVLLFIALTTNWADIPHDSLSGEGTVANGPMSLNNDYIDENMVTQSTRGKSVFRTSRVTATRTVDELGRYEFKGTSERAGVKRAYFRDTKRKKTLTVSVGDNFAGKYKVVAIGRGSIELRRGNESITLRR